MNGIFNFFSYSDMSKNCPELGLTSTELKSEYEACRLFDGNY